MIAFSQTPIYISVEAFGCIVVPFQATGERFSFFCSNGFLSSFSPFELQVFSIVLNLYTSNSVPVALITFSLSMSLKLLTHCGTGRWRYGKRYLRNINPY